MARSSVQPPIVPNSTATASRLNTITVGSGAVPQKITKPKEIIYHCLTDGDLDTLENSNGDGLSEKMWGLCGIAGGALMPAIRHTYGAFFAKPVQPIDISDFIEIIYFAICGSVAFAIFMIATPRSKTAKSKFAEIRKRPKTPYSV